MEEGRKKTNCSHYRTNKNQYRSKREGGGCVLEGHCSYCTGLDLSELHAVAKAQGNRSHLNANSDKGQLD